ncbi:MAG TPA: MBL fold metallo-hydrolase [Allosphingosinicella sp.]|jgi:L-ascorbate metabolism protein UlaG (beta-lactamase superfamily)|nr:MBL fold metallo-hydrolase [Allosphingosinicella sp.]
MRKLLKRLGTGLLFLVVALALAPSLIPPFLDRIYYDGPRSDHYDGERFFNPGAGDSGHSAITPQRFMNRLVHPAAKAEWPERVPVRQTVPPRRVEGEEMQVTWIGHASVLIQTQGLNILTDPVWAERTSPVSFIGPRRVRAPGVRLEDLPKIDLIVVSHNHYDHMDMETLRHIQARDGTRILVSLGNDTLLRSHGIRAEARDWGESVRVGPAEVVVERVHHWSSRWGTDRNRALWSGFTFRLPGGNVFFAGDTGFGDGSWPREAAQRGPFRLAIIPIGAYEPRNFMKSNHINPDEAVAIFETLRPGMALGMHWGTVQLTFEAIDAPPRRLAEVRRARGIPDDRFITPEVGETFTVPPLGR